MVSLSPLQIRAEIWLMIRVPDRILEDSQPLAIRRRPPIVARKALVPKSMPIGLDALGITVEVAQRALARGFGAAVWRRAGAGVVRFDNPRLAVVCELRMTLSVGDSGGGLLLEGSGFGELEFLFDGLDGLFGEFLLDAAGAFGADAGGVALWHGDRCAGELE
jgi:hypothetical protein